ncbi:hypothetical protein MXB_1910, partial [Myxobolus squamalis]
PPDCRSWKLPNRKTLVERIRQLRGNSVKIEKINNPPFSVTCESFLFFGVTYMVSNKGFSVLRMESSAFIDATFRVTSASFLQCMIIMGFDPTSNVYVPCVWALISPKYEYLYCEDLHISLVAKACRRGLGKNVAKRCMLSVHWH